MKNDHPTTAFVSSVTACMLLVPAAAWASGGHGFDLKTHGLYIIDFLVVFVPLSIWAAPRLRKFLQGRYDEVKADIDEATRDFEEAEAGLKAAKSRMDNLTVEIEGLMAEFKELGEKERDALAHEGAVQAEKIRGESDFHISQAVKMARMELRETVIQQSLDTVLKGLSAEGGKAVSEQLVTKFVDGVGRGEPEA